MTTTVDTKDHHHQKKDETVPTAVVVDIAAAAAAVPSTGSTGKSEKSYFEVLALCCSSEVALIEKILKPLEGVNDVSVIVPSKTVIVLHDPSLISNLQIVKALNKARLEANIRVRGDADHKKKWPNPYVIICGLLLSISFLKYIYHPLEWLALGAVAIGIVPILLRGIAAVRNFTLDVNILMLIAVAGTIALRDYLESGTIVFLFTIAEWLESRASHKANAVMSSLMSIAPQRAVIAATGESVDVGDVKLDTILAVKAGETVPIDGIVVDGNADIDEKMLTGESFPVNKEKDATVFAGAIVLNGYISLKTTALAEDCVVSRMAKLVEEAQNNKSKTQRLIDKCSKYYTPVVVLISACFAAIPAALRLPDQRHWFHLALVVLVSACPCGLILSTPVATFCAMSKAATIGLLFKGGDYLEILAKTKTVAFDKTGTITKGEFLLTDFCSVSKDVSIDTLLYWVSSIEGKSSHPIATTVVDYAESLFIKPKPENVEEFQSFPGEGICGKIDEHEIFIGNRKFGERAGCAITLDTEDVKRVGKSSGYIYSRGALMGSFCLSDTCRLGAVEAVRDLNSKGIRTIMLTGDSHPAAMNAQNQLGQALSAVYAELLPEEKASIIEECKKTGTTVMVGDGVNDAPALAVADVGISMGVSGSALATETGHVILMSNDIRKIPKAIQLAKDTHRKVIENVIFSIAVKACIIGLAFAGHPLVWLAVLADVLTCLIVICNSMLLLRGSHHHGLKQKCKGAHKHGHKQTCHGSHQHSHEQKCEGSHSHCHGHKEKCHGTHIHGHKQVCHVPHDHGHKACNTTKATSCESSKCESQNCASSAESVIHAGERSQGCEKHQNSSKDTCRATVGELSNECQSICGKIPDDAKCCEKNSCTDSAEQHVDPDCCKAVTCNEKSCCTEEGLCCEELLEQQGCCQVDDKIEEKCCDEGSSTTVDHEIQSTDLHCHQTHHSHLEHKELEIKEATCTHGTDNQMNGPNHRRHCPRKHQTVHSSSRGHVDPMTKQACIAMGNREIVACCRIFRQDCCAHGKFTGFGSSLAEIVIE